MTSRKPAPLSAVRDVVLRSADGTEMSAQSLWAEGPVYILFIRRPGCVLCRAEARRVWTMKMAFDKLGIRPVVLVHEWLPAEVTAFRPRFWGGEVFLDKNKEFYKALGEGKVRKGSWLKFVCGLACLVPKYNEAKAIAPESESNVKGQHMVMGGVMVVKKGSGGVVYQFTEDNFGDHPPYEVVLEQCQKASGKSLSKEEFDNTIHFVTKMHTRSTKSLDM